LAELHLSNYRRRADRNLMSAIELRALIERATALAMGMGGLPCAGRQNQYNTADVTGETL